MQISVKSDWKPKVKKVRRLAVLFGLSGSVRGDNPDDAPKLQWNMSKTWMPYRGCSVRPSFQAAVIDLDQVE